MVDLPVKKIEGEVTCYAAPPYRSNRISRFTTASTAATVSVLIAPANPDRIGFTIYNNVNNTSYITFGETSAGSTPSFIIGAFGSFVWPAAICYTGPIAGIRNAGTGTFTITEILI